MAITRTQIAKQLLANGGRIGFQGGGKDASQDDFGGGNTVGGGDGDNRDRYMGTMGKTRPGRNPMAQFGSGPPKTRDFNFMDEARKTVNPLGFLTELPGLYGIGFRAITPNPFGFSSKGPTNTGGRNGGGNTPLWAQLGYSSEAEYLAALDAQGSSDTDQEPEIEEDEGLFRRFRAEGGIMNTDVVGGEFDFESARQMYGLGKLVKKVTRTVKKIAKSPIGKAAIGYALTGGLSNMAAGRSFGSNFFSPSSFISKGGIRNIFTKEGLSNIAFGAPGKYLGSPRRPNTGILTKGTSGLFGSGGEFSPLKAITGVSALSGLLTAEQEEEAQLISDNTGIDIEEIRANPDKYLARRFKAEGGSIKEPVAKKTMPLLDMGGKEMDLRAEGGFVPIGRMEKADDVPARLSKNEFVFTADAVRNAGEGNVDKGAEVMYNMMKNLESGGEVSEESQGLEGARKMFQTSQRLEEVL